MKPIGKLLLIVLFLFAGTGTSIAGVLYARLPGTEAPVYNLRISNIRTSIRIAGQLAVTHVDEEFHNDNGLTLEGFYAFSLPEGARVDGLWLWVDGKRLIFTVKTKEEAQRLYDSVVVGQRRDPALLESLGKNRFQLKIFPIAPHSSRRIELRYFTTLPLTEDGTVHYRYPLNLQGYQSVPVEQTSLHIDVDSQLPLTDIQTNFDDRPLLCRTAILTPRSFTIDFGSEDVFYAQDFELAFKPDNIFTVFPALSYKDPDEGGDHSYFMCWHPVRLADDVSQPRDLVFVLDASGSMTSERIETVRDAVKAILQQLRDIDRFRIVLFSSVTSSFPLDNTLLDATTENILAGRDYIDRMYMPGGSTNYELAFRTALDCSFRTNAVRRMLFLTDGMPNSGVTGKEGLLDIIEDRDELGVGIYPVIVYSDRIELLYDIADARGGKVTLVEPGDDLQTIISRIMLELNISGVSNPEVRFETGNTWLVYPKDLGSITSIDRLVTTGRITGSIPELVRLSYREADGTPVEALRSVDFLGARTDLRQVASYWAAAHIDMLLDEYDSNPTDELKMSIVTLSIQHRILTPFTAFLVLETNPIDPPVLSTGTTEVIPEHVVLAKNYPNPYSLSTNSATTIPYTMTQSASVHIVITDVLGRVVRILQNGPRPAGSHSVQWNGRDESGALVTPGVYFVRLISGDVAQTMRLTILR
jgi:Ca-activated chloride channel family protein